MSAHPDAPNLPIAGACTGCRPSCGGSNTTEGCSNSLSHAPVLTSGNSSSADNGPLLEAPEHVLSTLEKDGRRRWLRPWLSQGKWWHRRRAVAYVLMVIFVLVPHIQWGGKPLIRLDIAAREFTILFHTFLPTDTLLLALTMLFAFISIVFITSVTGRAWCGWACPQTVYIEYLFRPIDRFFEGTVGKGGQPKKPMSAPKQIARLVVYVLLTMFLAHTFLAYFVGPEKLSQWIQSSPVHHPVAFIVMAATTLLLFYDFYIFREQTCLIACPYGRFQSVMLDRQSLMVAYDYNRGEPRERGRRTESKADNATLARGDCVDCNQCVQVCPTGIDIRDGLQMECINCTQCIDACDRVMDKVGLPTGLIRYSSQDALDGKSKRMFRARTVIYPIILLLVGGAFVAAVSTKFGFDARVIRGRGAPFTRVDRDISNSFRIRVFNRTDAVQSYSFEIAKPSEARLEIVDESTLNIQPGEDKYVPLFIRFPPHLTEGTGRIPIEFKIVDSAGNTRLTKTNLLGPKL